MLNKQKNAPGKGLVECLVLLQGSQRDSCVVMQ